MKNVLSGHTNQELEKILTHTDLTMNEFIRERLGLPKNKD
jgi:hypothetical protein